VFLAVLCQRDNSGVFFLHVVNLGIDTLPLLPFGDFNSSRTSLSGWL
jgi:hypothetical protein